MRWMAGPSLGRPQVEVHTCHAMPRQSAIIVSANEQAWLSLSLGSTGGRIAVGLREGASGWNRPREGCRNRRVRTSPFAASCVASELSTSTGPGRRWFTAVGHLPRPGLGFVRIPAQHRRDHDSCAPARSTGGSQTNHGRDRTGDPRPPARCRSAGSLDTTTGCSVTSLAPIVVRAFSVTKLEAAYERTNRACRKSQTC
jgi:hypothetical protein